MKNSFNSLENFVQQPRSFPCRKVPQHLNQFPFHAPYGVSALLTYSWDVPTASRSYSPYSQRHTLSHIPCVVLQGVTFHRWSGASQERLFFVGPDFERHESGAARGRGTSRAYQQLAGARYPRTLAPGRAQAPLQIALLAAVAGGKTSEMKPFLGVGLACVLAGFVGGFLYRSAFPRYRIYSHDYALDGNHMPIFLKFDSRTGQAWKSRGLDQQWHKMTDTNAP